MDKLKVSPDVTTIITDFKTWEQPKENKIKYYSEDDFKFVTSVIISQNHKSLVLNRLGFKIFNELEYLHSTESLFAQNTSLRLNGLMQVARAIQLQYRSDT